MNDDFLNRIRVKPSAHFAAKLKAKLDRQAALMPRRRLVVIRTFIAAALIATAAFAVNSPTIRQFVSSALYHWHGSDRAAVAPTGSPSHSSTASNFARQSRRATRSSAVIATPTPAPPSTQAAHLPSTTESEPVGSEATSYSSDAPTSTMMFAASLPLDISGAGDLFPAALYTTWSSLYQQQTGVGLSYQSVGSDAGIKQIKAKAVTFGATDMPLLPIELAEAGLRQFPMIVGGVVPIINIKGVQSGQLTLDGATLASIYLYEITKWNDPRIQTLNPTFALPGTSITPVHRSDDSALTSLFTSYLARVSYTFRVQIGTSTFVSWPGGADAKGDEGMANATAQIDGAIGYVSYRYARQNNLPYAQLLNKAGKVVAPTGETLQAAASAAAWSRAADNYLVLVNQDGALSWPITGASFILVNRQSSTLARTTAAFRFFDWAYANGSQIATELDYVPLPENVIEHVRSTWRIEMKPR